MIGRPAISGGFQDPARDAARGFRAAMRAMARPGTIEQTLGAVPPAPLSAASGALILILCDGDTPVYLAPSHNTEPVRDWITFHTGAPFCAAPEAHFAVGCWDALQPLNTYPIGTPEYPDRSATLIVAVEALEPQGAQLSGPGIETVAELSLPDLAPFQSNRALFPLGLDFYFTSGDRLAALPRSTTVKEPA
jgi:alpha-D-ribose 1-methylphosphonate 5-triphosphate synthase subunit PhnH